MIKYILIILLEVVSFDCNASFLVRLTWIDKTKAFGNEAITFYVDDISFTGVAVNDSFKNKVKVRTN